MKPGDRSESVHCPDQNGIGTVPSIPHFAVPHHAMLYHTTRPHNDGEVNLARSADWNRK